jgi:hypothetical protein
MREIKKNKTRTVFTLVWVLLLIEMKKEKKLESWIFLFDVEKRGWSNSVEESDFWLIGFFVINDDSRATMTTERI